ncbi:hypothetical protein [Dyella sp. ASV21]|uniref:hypothetical protein n=1 Tax=Dyella sp. ASV21 TaxID=2795114 RepID=UPI0018ED6CDA|nr:hypothetical protein [Dyella sp. ASV21]
MSHAPIARLLIAGLWSMLGTSQAFSQIANTRNDEVTPALAMEKRRYLIPMKGCAVEMVARKGGRSGVNSGSPDAGFYVDGNYYYLSNDKDQKELLIDIKCVKGSASELCPKLMPPEPEGNVRYYSIKVINDVNSRYFNYVEISSYPLNSGDPGQVRRVSFCMGDGSRTLLSRESIYVGYDPRDVSDTAGQILPPTSEAGLPEVIEILRSIRFVSQIESPTPKS